MNNITPVLFKLLFLDPNFKGTLDIFLSINPARRMPTKKEIEQKTSDERFPYFVDNNPKASKNISTNETKIITPAAKPKPKDKDL